MWNPNHLWDEAAASSGSNAPIHRCLRRAACIKPSVGESRRSLNQVYELTAERPVNPHYDQHGQRDERHQIPHANPCATMASAVPAAGGCSVFVAAIRNMVSPTPSAA